MAKMKPEQIKKKIDNRLEEIEKRGHYIGVDVVFFLKLIEASYEQGK